MKAQVEKLTNKNIKAVYLRDSETSNVGNDKALQTILNITDDILCYFSDLYSKHKCWVHI